MKRIRRAGVFMALGVGLAAGPAAVGVTVSPPDQAADALLSAFAFRTRARPDAEVIFVPAVASPPVIDGHLDDDAWAEAFTSERFTWGGGRPGRNRTQLWIARDAAHLYFAFRAETTPGVPVTARYPEGFHGGAAWGDECFDLQMSGDGFVTTAQFLVTAGGAHYSARNARADWNPDGSRAARIGDGFYSIEVAIPLAALRIAPSDPAPAVHASINRADRSAGQLLSFTEPYGEPEQGAVLVLGSREDYERRQAGGVLSRETQLALRLDRDVYPSFQAQATGRVTLSGPSAGTRLHDGAGIEIVLLRDGQAPVAQRLSPVTGERLDFDLPLAGLAPGEYVLEARAMDGDEVVTAARQGFRVERAEAVRSGSIPVTVSPADGDTAAWPLTFGVPFARGALASDEHLRLLDADGREVPAQVTTASRWSRGGSVRWALIDTVVPVGREAAAYRIEYGPGVARTPMADRVEIQEDGDMLTVANGPLRLVFRRSGRPGLAEIWADLDGDGAIGETERVVRMDEASGPIMADEDGVVYYGAMDEAAEVEVEDTGPLRATVRVSGWHVAENGQRLGRFILRYVVHHGVPAVRIHHTFIVTESSNRATAGIETETRYSNIAHVIPFPASAYFFGTPRIHPGVLRGGENAWLLQHDDLTCRVFHAGRFSDECEKAEGWMTVGGGARWMTLAVRDFWQQFPKELEVARDRVAVHFWPRHGEPNRREGENLSIRTVYPQWFAHAGRVLDFRIPDEVLEYVRQDSEQHNWPNARVANAMGLAKTHEILLRFHAQDWETARARTTTRVFQSNPTATCDPAYVCATGVFGEMAPRVPGAFEAVERAVDRAIDSIFRHQAMDRDYGMFNYGDAHHNWHWQERRWNLHRIWRNTHHGWTRWPWLMYARTGRKDLFDWGERNARRAADVGHCHHTTDAFAALPWPGQKIVGGICDYKGFVHWAAGGRLCYNSAADALLHHYYFTGDRRSRDTALAHGRALLADGRARGHREGSGRLTSAAELYFHTWDNDYLDFVRRTADALLNTQLEDGRFPQWENFAPFLQRYVELTGSPRGRAAMVRWGDAIVAENDVAPQHHAKINILAHAALYSGDSRHLGLAALRMDEVVDFVYEGEDPRYQGTFIHAHTNMCQSYFMQEFPYYLEALRRFGREPERAVPDRTEIRTLAREPGDGEPRFVFRAFVRRPPAASLTLPVRLRGAAGQSYRVEALPAGGGDPVGTEGAAPGHANRATLELTLPAGEDRDFEVRVISDANFFTELPLSYGLPDVGEVYPLPAGGTWIVGRPPIRFNVPPRAERFRLAYHGRAWPLKAQLFDPSGAPAGEDVWIGSNALGGPTRRLGADVAGQPEGWTFLVIGNGQANLVGFEVDPPEAAGPLYFSFDQDRLFDPAR